jgi:hypothetical protein
VLCELPAFTRLAAGGLRGSLQLWCRVRALTARVGGCLSEHARLAHSRGRRKLRDLHTLWIPRGGLLHYIPHVYVQVIGIVYNGRL